MSGIGEYAHLVTLATAGPTVDDPEGGYVETWVPLTPPTWYCSIVPATLDALERISGGGLTQTATHVLRGRYHPTLTADCRITFRGRVLSVSSVHDPDQSQFLLTVIAHEITTGAEVAP